MQENTATSSNALHHSESIASGINKVFEHRKNFIVIGLTGRTGSGCTTAAQILGSSYEKLRIPSIANPPKTHEDRKWKIIQMWAENHWRPFTTVSATSLILMLAIERGANKFASLAKEIEPKINKNNLTSELKIYESDAKQSLKTIKELRTKNQSQESIEFAFKFFTERANDALLLVKDLTKNHGAAYTKLFQELGNNIRCSGDPFDKSINPNSIFTIPETLESIIRLLRKYFENIKNQEMYIAIDALRHPYEIRYLRERISSFYTVAVSTTDLERRRRLHDLQLTTAQVQQLDETEYPDKIADTDQYIGLVKQNIQACLELSDIYISNTGGDEKNRQELARQLVHYVSLMQHPGLVTPTAIERCMQAALTAKANSGCISRQVGAVVTDKNYSIKAMGWNDAPHGQVPCLLRNAVHLNQEDFDTDAYSDYEKSNSEFKNIVIKSYHNPDSENYLGRNLSYCFKSAYNTQTRTKNQVHTRSLHAEENAFLQIAKYGGQSIDGGMLFTTASPCELCAKKAYQLGIKKIYYIDPYPGIATTHVLASGNIRPETQLFDGAIGTAYHNLYQPIMSFKDELPRLLAARKAPA
ncbi:hypothetical protein KTD33_04290 [Burkholderia gladioli]|uniref:hypothetical protein n=1 Tax=Burkholderia gladioli TaxID=28095 RepID=UPI00163E989F|nr:hypothetical protein [Burkholderia gladioli]MBU9193750.1 hypothetical protein [Burkholderia gladioli]